MKLYESLILRNSRISEILDSQNPLEGVKRYISDLVEYASGIDIPAIEEESKLVLAKHIINSEKFKLNSCVKLEISLKNYKNVVRNFESYFRDKLKRVKFRDGESPGYEEMEEMGLHLTYFDKGTQTFVTYFLLKENLLPPLERLKRIIEALGEENIEKVIVKG